MTLIHQINSINDTTYIDNNNIAIDQKYCYVVSAMYDYDQVEDTYRHIMCHY